MRRCSKLSKPQNHGVLALPSVSSAVTQTPSISLKIGPIQTAVTCLYSSAYVLDSFTLLTFQSISMPTIISIFITLFSDKGLMTLTQRG